MSEKKFNFKRFNKELVESPEKFDYSSLKSDILFAYLKNSKYTDDKGVIRYRTDFNKDADKVKKMASDISDRVEYHLHKRYFDLDDSKIKSLKSIKDPNGISISEILRGSYMPGTETKTLEKILDAQPKINDAVISKMASDIAGKHDSAIISKKVNYKIGDDYGMLKEGVKALNKEYDIMKMGRLNKEIKYANAQDLAQIYFGLIEGARNKKLS